MRRSTLIVLLVCIMAVFSVSNASAAGMDMAVSIRAGIPTDVLVNIVSLYSFGLAVEASYGAQVLDWLIVGGVAGYGFGNGVSVAPPFNSYYSAAARVGFGSLKGISGSLIGGIVYMPLGLTPIIVDLGVSLDWEFLSLAVSTGSVSVGVNLRLF